MALALASLLLTTLVATLGAFTRQQLQTEAWLGNQLQQDLGHNLLALQLASACGAGLAQGDGQGWQLWRQDGGCQLFSYRWQQGQLQRRRPGGRFSPLWVLAEKPTLSYGLDQDGDCRVDGWAQQGQGALQLMLEWRQGDAHRRWLGALPRGLCHP